MKLPRKKHGQKSQHAQNTQIWHGKIYTGLARKRQHGMLDKFRFESHNYGHSLINRKKKLPLSMPLNTDLDSRHGEKRNRNKKRALNMNHYRR